MSGSKKCIKALHREFESSSGNTQNAKNELEPVPRCSVAVSVHWQCTLCFSLQPASGCGVSIAQLGAGFSTHTVAHSVWPGEKETIQS